MKPTKKWKIIGAVAGLIFLSVAGVSVAASYKEKDFDPGAYEDRNRKDNQILFPGQDISLGDEEQENDSELWQQDKNADEDKKPEDRPSSSVLFQTMKVADDGAQNDNAQQEEQQDPQNDNDVIYTPGSQTDPKIPSAHKKDDQTTDNEQPQVKPTKTPSDGNGGKDDGKKDPNKDDGNGNNDKPGTPDTPDTPDTPVTPTPTPDVPSTDPTDPSDNSDNKNDDKDKDDKGDTEDPEKPSHEDPDTSVPTLPKDDTVIDADPYPGDKDLDIKEDDYKKYSLKIIGLRDSEDMVNSLYMGEYLNDQRVFCSVLVYVCEDDVPKYRLTELDDNFKLGSYPEQVTEDKVPLTFYFRPSAEYDWIEAEYDAEVIYSAKLLLKDLDNQETYKQVLVPKDDPQIPLASYYYDVAGHNVLGFEADPIERLFLGWSETENGDSVGPLYEVTKTGAQVLYARQGEPLSEPTKADWQYAYFMLGDMPYYVRIQVLTNAEATDGVLTIPDGVQALDLEYGFDMFWTPVYETCDTIKIPDSVMFLSTADTGEDQEDYFTFVVNKAYEVGKNNPYYAAEDGILYNHEKTQILSVPRETEKLTVAEQVESVHFIDGNALQEIHFTADKPIAVNFSQVNNATIYVPTESYLKYLSAWGKNPGGTNRLVASGEETPVFTEDDTAIYSEDGKTLLSVKSNVSGVYVVKEGVEKIAEGALDNCGSIELLLLPKSLKELESKSLSGNAPQKILLLGTTPPSIAKDSFSADSVVQVETVAKTAYEAAFAELLPDGGQMIDRIFSYVAKEDGYSYLTEEEDEIYPADALLISVPEDITSFTEQSLPEVQLTEIAPGAFAGCTRLHIAELPAGLQKIGAEAFSGCSSLEGIISYETEMLEIGNEAFADTYSLRFAAFNAYYLDSYDYWGTAAWFGVNNGIGYYSINRYSPNYYLEDMAGGKLLYGVAVDENGNPTDDLYLVGATTDIAGTVKLEENTFEITDKVFQGCSNPFTVEGLEKLAAIDDYAFESSGIQGDITLGGDLIYLGSSAFRYCSRITGLTMDGSSLDKTVFSSPFGLYAFEYCTALEQVKIVGDGEFDISSEAFAGCTSLTSIFLKESTGIRRIGYSAFVQTAITSLELPACVDEISYGAFDACVNLTEIRLASEVPPALTGYSTGWEFTFGEIGAEEGFIKVPEGAEQDYIDVWKYEILGYTIFDMDDLTEEQLLEGENRVRRILGLPEKEEEEVPSVSENDIAAGTDENTDDLPVTVSENAVQ